MLRASPAALAAAVLLAAATLGCPAASTSGEVAANTPGPALQVTLTVTKLGAGSGTVTSVPAGISCGATCSASFDADTVVTLTAAPAGGSTFTGWSGTGVACPGTGACAVTLDQAKTVAAAFSTGGSGPFSLTVTKAGTGSGTVTSSPAGISCGATCSASFDAGTVVTLSQAAAAGSTFTGWSGACTGSGTCAVTMSQARTVTATFARQTFALTVNKAGTGSGTVTSAPAGISCGATCSANFTSGASVVLTAAAAGGSVFAGWSGTGITCPGTGTCTVAMSQARTVVATFNSTATSYLLTVSKAGSGTVTSSPAGISCGATCSASFDAGSVVTLTAAAASGYTFTGWSGSGLSCLGTGPCAVTMSQVRTVLASFTNGDVSDLCAGLVTDTANHPMTGLAKPALGVAFRDPEFGTTMRRISNAAGRGVNVVKPVYSTIQAWNADESYLVLYHTDGSPSGHFLYDGRTYAFIKELNISPADLEQVYWSPTDPKILYYTNITYRRLYAFNVDTDTATLVKDFSVAPVSCNTDITGGTDPMWTSWDGRFFGYTCGRGAGAKMFTYDMDADVIPSIYVGNSGGNAPQPAPSGALFYLNPSDGSAQVRDASMNLLRTLDVLAGEHATLGTADGVDTHFSIQFDTNPPGNVIAVNMTNGAKRVIIGEGVPGWPQYPVRGAHLSAVAYQRPGWLATDAVGEATGQTVLDSEVVLINANTGGTICRVGHHRSCGSSDNCGTAAQGYWAEPHATISPSGTRILFASDWSAGSPKPALSQIVDTYVIELPGYRP